MIVNRRPFAGFEKLVEEWWPDIARATRGTLGLIVPLLLAETGKIPLHVIFAAIAAQNVAMAEVRGSYPLRLAILSSGALLLGLTAGLGSMSSQYLWMALLFAALMAVVAGGLRHLSADYGPQLAAPIVFIFLMALGAPSGRPEVRISPALHMGRRGIWNYFADGSVALSTAASLAASDRGVLARSGKLARSSQ